MNELHTPSPRQRMVCPHLGQSDGLGAALNRPSDMHRCFTHADEGEQLSHRQQAQYCLVEEWAACYKLQPGYIPPLTIPTIEVPAPTPAAPAPTTRRLFLQDDEEMAASGATLSAPIAAPPARPGTTATADSPTVTTARGDTVPVPLTPPGERPRRALGVLVGVPVAALLLASGWVGLLAMDGDQAAARAAVATLPPGEQVALYDDLLRRNPAISEERAPRLSLEPSATVAPATEGEEVPVIPINPDLPPRPLVMSTMEARQGEQAVEPLLWPAEPATAAPDRIWAPRVAIDAKVIPVGSHVREENGLLVRRYDVAHYAAGWHDNSSLPGFLGNIVLSGHHNTSGRVFAGAWNLEIGDLIYLDAQGRTYPYVVARKEVFPETSVSEAQRNENGRWIGQTTDERLTLVTCWPPTSNTHRVVIVAVPAR